MAAATSAASSRKSDGTISVEGVRFEIPGRYRHFRQVSVRYARWDLRRVDLVDPRSGTMLSPLYPLDRQANADGHGQTEPARPASLPPCCVSDRRQGLRSEPAIASETRAVFDKLVAGCYLGGSPGEARAVRASRSVRIGKPITVQFLLAIITRRGCENEQTREGNIVVTVFKKYRASFRATYVGE